jgi:thioredoxin 1
MVKILYFSASWCGPCKKFRPVMDSVRTHFAENPDVEVISMDVDLDGESAAKYSVVSVPTLIYLKNGAVVHRMLGPQSKPTIINKITDLLRN